MRTSGRGKSGMPPFHPWRTIIAETIEIALVGSADLDR
jgi:hypothetical protein